MMRILLREEQGTINTDLPLDQLAAALKNPANIIWLDLSESATSETENLLGEIFRFHPLAIEDALHETHVPKVDDWHDYLYVVLRAVSLQNHDSQELQVPELDLFLGENFVVTYSKEAIAVVDRVWNLFQQDKNRLSRGTSYLIYQLADELVTDAVAVVEQMRSNLEEIEEQIFGKASPDLLEDLFSLKRLILKLRRITVPQRDVLNKLSRNEYQLIDAVDRIFFRDVYDHVLQLNDLLEDMLILVSSALDTYLSVVNNRMNDVIKTLTIITALFMPLAFITGFFGMNFFQVVTPFDAWTSLPSFIAVLALMILVPLFMFLWMRLRHWI